MTTAPQRIHLRAGTQAEWAVANPILEVAEPGYETDTERIKVGDGVTPWADLPYGHLNSDPRTINSLGFTLDAALTAAQGQLTWNADEQTLDLGKGGGVNTLAWEEGDVLWCDPATPGGFVNVEPHAPFLKLPVAAVISKKTQGILMVRSDTGRRLMDLHDVEANGTKQDGDLIHWSDANNRWEPTDRLTSLELRVAALEGP